MAWLALLLLRTSTEVWVMTAGATPACGDAAFVSVLHDLRPQLPLHAGTAPDERSIQITLNHEGNTYTLGMVGPEISIRRTFQDPGDCSEALRTGAFIVDGAFDEAQNPDAPPRIDAIVPPPIAPAPKPPLAVAPRTDPPSSPSPPLEMGVAVSGGAEQTLIGVRPNLGLDLHLDRGWLNVGIDGEFIPRSTYSNYAAIGFTAEAVAGGVVQLPRGRLLLDVGAGVTWTAVSITDLSSLPHLYGGYQTESAANVFVGVRAGYTLDLPLHLFAFARVEERLSPMQPQFAIGGISQVTTRTWTLEGTLGLGWRFR